MEKTDPQYDDLNYDDLTTALSRLDTKVKGEAMYGDDPIVLTYLKSELDYVKNLMEKRAIEETTFTEGNDGTVNISGPSRSSTVPGVDFVEDPNNLLPDVLDAFDDSFDTDWFNIEKRLSKLKKFSEDRLTAVTRVIKGKEGLILDPKNKYVRELIKRSSVRTLNDGTEVLVFRSEQGIDKSGTQIMKRGKTKIPVYSKNSIALREYKDLIKKIKEVPTDPDNIIGSDESIYEDTKEEPQFDESSEEFADRENIGLIDIGAKIGDLPGLTMEENNELRGVLNPPEGSSMEGRIGPAERIDSLKEARDRTLEQRVLEETKEAQLEDISRLRKFVKWLGEEKVGLTGIAISTAGLLTTILIHARGAIVKTAKATGKVAKALANLAKKAGPILAPILNTVATVLSWGAKGITWLASHLWVLAVAAALLVYNNYNNEYYEIWEGDLGAEDLDELNKLYPGYREMKPEDMDSEIDILRRKITGPEQLEEKEDIKREIEYVSQLRRMKTWKNSETKLYLNATHRTLKEEEAETKRRREAVESDKEKTEYWRKKLEEREKEKYKPKEEPKKEPKEEPKEEPNKPKTEKPYRGKEPKKSNRGKETREPLPGVDTEWVEDTFNFENLLFQVAEDSIPEDDQPIFSGDSTEIMLKDIREDLTRHERFKSWVEDNFGFVLAGVMVSVAALLSAIIIQTRKLSSMTADSTHGGGGPSPSPFPLPDIVSKLIKFISSNLWVVAVGIGIILLYMNS
ncbi:Hypothetical predicted protein [Paramuricea clavata]|uniref:Uncharacterized protein n=1 Tax=Paramuricea clavata TaxID=317549 RepID=A0A6S7HU75_PARCT|nr:Hypothetical predicted protein [Paramuricea clavata]